jgi:hypothetical protein
MMRKIYKKYFWILVIFITSISFGQVQKKILVEFNTSYDFTQFFSQVTVRSNSNNLLYGDYFANPDDAFCSIYKRTAVLVDINDLDFPLGFEVRGNTLYTTNLVDINDLDFPLGFEV